MFFAVNGFDQCQSAQGPWEPQALPGALSCHRDVNKRGCGGGRSFSPEPVTPFIVCPIKICCRVNFGKNNGPKIKHKKIQTGEEKAQQKFPQLIF